MKLAIMQPYFFPYIGYFQLIHAVDEFILLDDVQYIRHGWVNRNRILKLNGDWQYVNAPLQAHAHGVSIREIETKSDRGWRDLVLRQLVQYKKIARHYAETVAMVETALSVETDNLARINMHALRTLACQLGMQTPIHLSSEMDFDYSSIQGPGDWALTMSVQHGADVYINPADGEALFDQRAFADAGIRLDLLRPVLSPYTQRRENFVSALSIIDVLMFNGVEKTKHMLQGHVESAGIPAANT